MRYNDTKRLKHDPVRLACSARDAVDAAIREVCVYRGWNLWALNVRSNHVHIVVTAPVDSAKVMTDFKSYATRRLRASGLVTTKTTVWTEGGSERWLNDEDSVHRVCQYVENQ